MIELKEKKITKSEFKKLKEDDVLFITNPGRMGDEDGTTFIIKKGNGLILYRIDGWMYPNSIEKEYQISMKETAEQFPEWIKAWKHGSDQNYNGKYKYIYMGFGNGLCVDKTIYNEFEPYLNSRIDEYLKDSSPKEKEDLKYAATYNVWENAVINMINDKGHCLKK
jgi:hypothetical protein